MHTKKQRSSYRHPTGPHVSVSQEHASQAKTMSKWYDKNEVHVHRLLLWHLNLPIVDLVNDVVWGLAVDGAADRLSGTQDLLAAVSEVLGEGF